MLRILLALYYALHLFLQILFWHFQGNTIETTSDHMKSVECLPYDRKNPAPVRVVSL